MTRAGKEDRGFIVPLLLIIASFFQSLSRQKTAAGDRQRTDKSGRLEWTCWSLKGPESTSSIYHSPLISAGCRQAARRRDEAASQIQVPSMPRSGGGGRGGSWWWGWGGDKQISVWEEKPVPLAGRSNLKLNRRDTGRWWRVGWGGGGWWWGGSGRPLCGF